MEPRFEVRYFGTHKMLVEFARKYSVGPRPLAVCIVVGIYLYFVIRSWWNGILPEMLPTLLFMGVVFTLLYFLPDYFTWCAARNAKKQNDGVLPETVITFGDIIEIHEGMMHVTVEYRKIVRVVQLKHSYVLMIGKRNGVILDPNGFTKGTFEEFKQFLRQVRPDLNLPNATFPWMDDRYTAS